MKRLDVIVGRGKNRRIIARIEPNENNEITESVFVRLLSLIDEKDYTKIRVVSKCNVKVVGQSGEVLLEIKKAEPYVEPIDWRF